MPHLAASTMVSCWWSKLNNPGEEEGRGGGGGGGGGGKGEENRDTCGSIDREWKCKLEYLRQ